MCTTAKAPTCTTKLLHVVADPKACRQWRIAFVNAPLQPRSQALTVKRLRCVLEGARVWFFWPA